MRGLCDPDQQVDTGALARGGPDGETGVHQCGAAAHAGEAVAHGRGGEVKSAAIVTDGKGEVFAVKADFEEGLGREGIFYEVVDGLLEDKIDVLAIVHRQPDLVDVLLDVDAIFDAPGFEEGGGKMSYPDEEVLQRIIPGVDAPDDIVHPFHEHHGAVLYFVHGLHRLGGAVLP